MTQEIFKWVCPECGKELISLYEDQLKQWRESHMMVHTLKSKKRCNKNEKTN